jgi:hypothetical protein
MNEGLPKILFLAITFLGTKSIRPVMAEFAAHPAPGRFVMHLQT